MKKNYDSENASCSVMISMAI